MADFRKITDEMIEKVSLQDIADEIGCSFATVRQARLTEESKASRSPPPGWEKGVLKLAEKQIAHFQRVVAKLRAT